MSAPQTQTSLRGVNITSKINPWVIDDNGTVFMRNSGLEIALQYWPPETSSVTTDHLEAIEMAYVNMMEGWNENKGRMRFITLHRPARLNEIMELEYPPSTDPLQVALVEAERTANTERVKSGLYKAHNYYIVIHVPDVRSVERSDRRPWTQAERDEILMRAETERQRLGVLLDGVNIPWSPVMENDAYDLMQSWYNQAMIADEPLTYDPNLVLPEDITLEQVRRDETVRIKTLRSQIVQSEILTESTEYLRNGDNLLLVQDLKDYGDEGYPGMADSFLATLVNYTYWYVVDVVFTGEGGNITTVERNASAAEQAARDSGKRVDAVRALKTQQETAMAYYQNGRFLKFGMSIVVNCPSMRVLRDVRNKIRTHWQGEGRHIMTPGHFTNFDQFVYRLAPYSGLNSDFLHIHQSSTIAQFLPYYGPWENVGGETLALMENAYGTQQRLTLPKQNENGAHMAFVGTTRSGKSFTLQKLLMGFYMQGDLLRIVDMKNDYEPLVAKLGGQFIPCYPGGFLPNGDPVRFNIFEAKDGPMTIADRRDVVAFLKALIAEPLNLELNAILTSAVNDFIDSKTNKVTNTFEGGILMEFVEFLYTTRRIGKIGFLESDATGKATRAFATALQFFCTGVYGSLFNGPSTVQLDNRVIVFDISQLGTEQNLTGAIMTIIRTNVWNAAKKRRYKDRRVVFVNEETGITGRIDEVKTGLQDMVMAGAADNLLTIIVAQNASSIKALDGVLNNVSRIIMGRLESTEEAQLLADLLQLNSEQQQTIMRLRRVAGVYNELFIREMKPDSIAQYGVVRYRPTDIEYALFDSSPEAKTRRAQLEDQYGRDYDKQLAIMVQERRAAQQYR